MAPFLDPSTHADRVADLLARHGDMAEHNAAHYACHGRPAAPNAFFVTDDGDAGALTQQGATWNMIAEPLAAAERRADLIVDVAAAAFAAGAAGLTFEARESVAAAAQAGAPAGWTFEHLRPYFWPVFDLTVWDRALPGGRFRDLRNKLNGFRRGAYEVVDAATVDTKALETLLDRWIGARERPEGVERSYYANGIARAFAGFDRARCVVVDGEAAAVSAGWSIPNSDGAFYAAWGIYDYAFHGVGEFLNWNDLVEAQDAGYRLCDFGGSDPTLRAYKSKFGPTSEYETHGWKVRSPAP